MKHARFLSVPPPQAITWLLTFMHGIRPRSFEPAPETPRPTGDLPFYHDKSMPSVVHSIHLGIPVPLELSGPRRPFEPEVYVSYLLYHLYADSGSKRAWQVGSGHEAVRFSFTPSLAGGTKLEIECLEPAFVGFVDELLEEIDASAGTKRERAGHGLDELDLPIGPHNKSAEAMGGRVAASVDRDSALASMTEHQREILRLWLEGKTSSQIAHHFGSVLSTSITKRISELRQKYGAHIVPTDAERSEPTS